MLFTTLNLIQQLNCYEFKAHIQMNQNTQSRKEKVRQHLLSLQPVTDQSSRTAAQETYVKKLRGDIDRTKVFLVQAQDAITQLNDELSIDTVNWDEKSRQQAHLVALYEAYKKLPYMAMKNDLIGIATAASLTKKAVAEHRQTSLELSAENKIIEKEISKQTQLLADYEEIGELLKQRILAHPERMTKLQAKLNKSQPLEAELDRKLRSVQNATTVLKSIEERLYQHVKRVVTKLHALQDWENASVMDEQMFKTSIVLSISLIVTLVSNLLSPTEKWVLVTPGGPEEKLLLVMVRNNLVVMRGNAEVRLREYGIEE